MPELPPTYRIFTFGELRVTGPDGRSVRTFTTKRVAALLAFLALWPERVHTRDALTEALWPEEDPEVTRPRLRQTLSLLKKDLAAGGIDAERLLEINRLELRLKSENAATDVGELRSLLRAARLADTPSRKQEIVTRAAALATGELLENFFDDWAVRERDVLHQALQAAQNTPELPEPTTIQRLLPESPTSFFGRQEEQETLLRLLVPGTLVTLTAIGGMGKTRLALELARREPGSAFVALADLTDDTQLPNALGEGLGLPAIPMADDPLARVIRHLRTRECPFLILDNAEHLRDAVSRLVLRLRAEVPGLRVLVTSRLCLGVAGEQELALAPLPIVSDALALFVSRAQLARPSFLATPENTPLLTRVCAKLDGIPLALEMTAAWLAMLTPEQIERRLSQRFTLLVSRQRDTPARQQSLRQVLESSIALLPRFARELLGALSVFAGGWTVESAEAICGDQANPFALLEGLALLRERALIQPFTGREGARFRMLETVRVFSQELGMPAAVPERHARYFAQLAKDERIHLSQSTERESLNRLEDEHENLNLALEFMAAHDMPLALSFACDLDHFWILRGHLQEGRGHLTALLAHLDAVGTARAWALRSLAILCQYLGAPHDSLEHFEAALALFVEADDTKGVQWVEPSLASIAIELGQYERAERILIAALDSVITTPLGRASMLIRLAKLNYQRGDYARSATVSREAWAIGEAEQSDRTTVMAQQLLGMALRELGAIEEAQHLLTGSLQKIRELGLTSSLASALGEQASTLALVGRSSEAQAALLEAIELWRELGNPTALALDQLHLADLHWQAGALEPARLLTQEAFIPLRVKSAPHAVALALELIARFPVNPEESARLLGAAEAQRAQVNYPLRTTQAPLLTELRQRLSRVLGSEHLAEQLLIGKALTTAAAVSLASQGLLLPFDKKIFR
jgi:predicted ATPase